MKNKSIGYALPDTDSDIKIMKTCPHKNQGCKYEWNFFLRWKQVSKREADLVFPRRPHDQAPSQFLALQTRGCGFDSCGTRGLPELQPPQLHSRTPMGEGRPRRFRDPPKSYTDICVLMTITWSISFCSRSWKCFFLGGRQRVC